MIVRCPQCQYANQVEADATKPRIVCARCATVISLEFLANPNVPPAADLAAFDLPVPDFFTEGHPSSASSIMKTPESPLDLDSLLEPPVEAAPTSPPMASSVLHTSSQPIESRWDTDEILEIPRASTTAEAQQDVLAVEDLLATTPLKSDAPHEFAESLWDQPAPLTGEGTAANGLWGTATHDTSEIIAPQTAAFAETPHLQFASESSPESVAEVVEPEPTPARPSVFAQDSYTRSPANTYVMATPDGNNKGNLAKIFLAAAVIFGLLGIGYFALSGLVKDWLGARQGQQAAVTATPGATPVATVTNATKPGATPSVAASTGAKTGSEANKNASPTSSASVTASPKAAAMATATPAPSNQNAPGKPSPVPTTPQTGTSGHAVGAGDGSLTIQLGAYKSAGEAQQRVTKLKAAGVEGRVVKAEVPGKGVWYRVQSGRFTSETEASKHASELRAKGTVKDFIVTGYQNQ